MAGVRAALAQLGMSEYSGTFEELGFDEIGWLQVQPREMLLAIARDHVKMRIGHQMRFVDQLKDVSIYGCE